MGIGKRFKSPKVRILTALGLFFALTTGGAIWVGYAVKDQVKETAEEIAPAFSPDVISAAFDDRKCEHLGKAEWQTFIAQRYAVEKNYQKAHDAYVKARDESTEALGKDGVMTYTITGFQAHFEYQFRKYPLAEELFRQELSSLKKTKGSQKEIFYIQEWLANVLMDQGKIKQQINVLKDALSTARLVDQKEQSKSQEQTLDALDRLGSAYESARQYDKQEEICQQALTIARQLQDSKLVAQRLRDLGGAKCGRGDHAAAIKIYTEALSIDPNYLYAYTDRGWVYSYMHDYKHAIEDMNAAVKLDSQDKASSLCSRAGIYEQSGDYQKAIDDYTSAIAKSSRGSFTTSLYGCRASLFEKVGRLKDAIGDYTEILHHKEHPRTYIDRGDVYMQMHEPGVAIEDYSRALQFTESEKYQATERNPIASQIVYEKRAKAYVALGKPKLAEADHMRAQLETLSEQPKATSAAESKESNPEKVHDQSAVATAKDASSEHP